MEMKSLKTFKWVTIPFLSLTFFGAIAGLAFYIPAAGIHPLEPIYLGASVYLIAWVISAGYHRYFAHKTFECHPLLKIFYLVIGCAAYQQSALVWAADHRLHHRFVDTDKDPYNIKKGFWWAHIGWLFADDPPSRETLLKNAPDLAKDRWVMLQHKYWVWLSIPLAIGLPLAIGFMIGRPVGMFLWGCVLRIVITHHTTFTINSISHYFGTQPYTDENSARDVWWLGPILCGENYHNYHHCFPSDYRNGTRWYHWDPSKWSLWLLSHTGLVHSLRRVPSSTVLKARLEMDMKRLAKRLEPAPEEVRTPIFDRLAHLRQSLEEAAEMYARARKSYDQTKADWANRSRQSLEGLKATLRERKQNLQDLGKKWRSLIQSAANMAKPMGGMSL